MSNANLKAKGVEENPPCRRLVLTGGPGTGKTHALRKSLMHLVAEYGTGEVRLLFGAGGNSSLADDLATLPHTAGAYSGLKDDPEPFVKHFRREKTRRNRLFRAGRGGEVPRLLVIVDDFESVGQMRAVLRRLLDRIGPCHNDSESLLLGLRTIDPLTYEAFAVTPRRLHFGGPDSIGEFPDAMQQWARERIGERAAIWHVRKYYTDSWPCTFPSTVVAEEASDVTAGAICGAVGLPLISNCPRRSAAAASPWPTPKSRSPPTGPPPSTGWACDDPESGDTSAALTLQRERRSLDRT